MGIIQKHKNMPLHLDESIFKQIYYHAKQKFTFANRDDANVPCEKMFISSLIVQESLLKSL